MAQLRTVKGCETPVVELKTEYAILGRSASCDVVITNHQEISREHCGIRHYPDGSYTVLDFSSRNGTFVNGRQIFAETKLHDGDQIRLGRVAELIFERAPTAAAVAATGGADAAATDPLAAPAVAAEPVAKPPAERTIELDDVPVSDADPKLKQASRDIQNALKKKGFHTVMTELAEKARPHPGKATTAARPATPPARPPPAPPA